VISPSTPKGVVDLIEACWSPAALMRPSFQDIDIVLDKIDVSGYQERAIR
jgi:hypothetical protein